MRKIKITVCDENGNILDSQTIELEKRFDQVVMSASTTETQVMHQIGTLSLGNTE